MAPRPGIVYCWLAAFLAASVTALGQAHYPAGAEGIKGGSLPPPGIYARLYTFCYTADEFDGGPPWFDDSTAVIFAPRVIWITDYTIFGANYGVDLLLPFGYADIDRAPAVAGKSIGWSVGDLQLGLVLLGWHGAKWDLGAGYAIWVPSGSYHDPSDFGEGYWGHMLTLGGTYYFDVDKATAISVLNRYEFNHEHADSGITPGQVWTMEWGLSRVVNPGVELGFVGYFQWQTTKDSGPGASRTRDYVLAIGPEVSWLIQRLGVITSLRYNHEILTHGRPEGQTLTLTLTKRL